MLEDHTTAWMGLTVAERAKTRCEQLILEMDWEICTKSAIFVVHRFCPVALRRLASHEKFPLDLWNSKAGS
jgi:hypothetical protein